MSTKGKAVKGTKGAKAVKGKKDDDSADEREISKSRGKGKDLDKRAKSAKKVTIDKDAKDDKSKV